MSLSFWLSGTVARATHPVGKKVQVNFIWGFHLSSIPSLLALRKRREGGQKPLAPRERRTNKLASELLPKEKAYPIRSSAPKGTLIWCYATAGSNSNVPFSRAPKWKITFVLTSIGK